MWSGCGNGRSAQPLSPLLSGRKQRAVTKTAAHLSVRANDPWGLKKYQGDASQHQRWTHASLLHPSSHMGRAEHSLYN